MKPRVPVVWTPDYDCDIGDHVFPVEKYRGVHQALVAGGFVAAADVLTPEQPDRALLALAHEEEYLDDLDQAALTSRTRHAELPVRPDVIRAFARSASGTTLAARRSFAGGVAVHVGGGLHHAYAGHAEGFCFINDLAVAVNAVRRDGLAGRVAVVDLDVHQGNGTASIFRDDPAVFTLSLHQEHNYPFPKERGDLDVGLDDGTTDEQYAAALAPALEQVWAHRPELVVYQAGADPYHDDQLGGLALTLAGLERRDRMVIEGCCSRGIPLVVTLGGGYARRLEDTVHIHFTTCRLAIQLAGEGEQA